MPLIEQAQEALATVQALKRELASTPSLPGPAGPAGPAPPPGEGQGMGRFFDELREIRTALESPMGGLSGLRGPGGAGA